LSLSTQDWPSGDRETHRNLVAGHDKMFGRAGRSCFQWILFFLAEGVTLKQEGSLAAYNGRNGKHICTWKDVFDYAIPSRMS
jgi:hypothetical protein